jgi:hypothetical protein
MYRQDSNATGWFLRGLVPSKPHSRLHENFSAEKHG